MRIHRLTTSRGLVVFVVSMLLAQTAWSVDNDDLRFDNTEDLFEVCRVEAGQPEYAVASFACRGFIEGAVQYHDAVTDRRNLKPLICYPKGTHRRGWTCRPSSPGLRTLEQREADGRAAGDRAGQGPGRRLSLQPVSHDTTAC